MSADDAARHNLRAALAQREAALQAVAVNQAVFDRTNGFVAECEAAVASYSDVQREAAEARAAALARGDRAMTLPDHIRRRLAERERADGQLAEYIEARTVLAEHLATKQRGLAAAENGIVKAVAAVCARTAADLAHELHGCEARAMALRTHLLSIDAATPANEPLPPVVVDMLRNPPLNAQAQRDLAQAKAWADYRARLRGDADALPPDIPFLPGSLDAAQAATAERQAVQARIEAAQEHGRRAQELARQTREEGGQPPRPAT